MTFPERLLSTTILLACAALAAAGCSKDDAAPSTAASSDKATAAAKATGKLVAADCVKLSEHMVDIGLTESLKDKSATEGMSEADKKRLADQMRKELKNDPETKKMAAGCENEISRAQFDCMMKAATEKALDACEKAP